jgi:hypothetical protein
MQVTWNVKWLELTQASAPGAYRLSLLPTAGECPSRAVAAVRAAAVVYRRRAIALSLSSTLMLLVVASLIRRRCTNSPLPHCVSLFGTGAAVTLRHCAVARWR